MDAAASAAEIVPAFVVDPALLASERMGAPLVQAFFGAVAALRDDLRARGSELAVLRGDPVRELGAFARDVTRKRSSTTKTTSRPRSRATTP